MAVGKNIARKKGKGEAILSSLKYSGCLEENQAGKIGRGRNFLGRNQDLNKLGDGEEYRVIGNFIHPCLGRQRVYVLTGEGGNRWKSISVYPNCKVELPAETLLYVEVESQ